MYKVFRHPEDIEQLDSTEMEFIGQYSNYSADEFEELPVISGHLKEAFQEATGMTDDEEFASVIYVVDSEKDALTLADKFYEICGGGGFFSGEFSFENDDYFIACPEFGNGCIMMPISFKDLFIAKMDEIEEV